MMRQRKTKRHQLFRLKTLSKLQCLQLPMATTTLLVFIAHTQRQRCFIDVYPRFEPAVLSRSNPLAHRPQLTLYNPTTYIRMQNTPIGLPSSAISTPTQRRTAYGAMCNFPNQVTRRYSSNPTEAFDTAFRPFQRHGNYRSQSPVSAGMTLVRRGI